MGSSLSASQAFYVIPILDLLVEPVQMVGIVAQLAVGIKVSMDRLTNFLMAQEHEPPHLETKREPGASDGALSSGGGYTHGLSHTMHGDDGGPYVAVSIAGGNFRWREGKAGKEEKKEAKQAEVQELKEGLENEFDAIRRGEMEERIVEIGAEVVSLESEIEGCGEARLLPVRGPPTLSGIDLKITRGSLSCIVGPVGSGKSSLLAAMLNEMCRECGEVTVCGSVAYCAQEPWIFQATVRENILFKKPMEADRYRLALDVCALGRDLDDLSGGKGDLTEIGEKGLNLSGGQKARISLARAVYANADVYLLDDIIAAVDAEVGKHIMEECVLGVLRDKTVVLVTNQAVQWLKPLLSPPPYPP